MPAVHPISIIVPCLNEEHYIGRLLISLSKQSHQDFEVVIIDGNSTDDTRGAVERTLQEHPNLAGKVHFFLADTKGISHQRNHGVRHASHERLLFLDADVQVRASFLSCALQEIEQRRLQLATVKFIPLTKRLDDHAIYFAGNLYIRTRQFTHPFAMGFCIFSTKRAHELVGGFDETLSIGEDGDYIKRAGKNRLPFRVLNVGEVYISIRRLNSEGRFVYYKKAILPEVYRLLGKKNLYRNTEYSFGMFGKNSEENIFDDR